MRGQRKAAHIKGDQRLRILTFGHTEDLIKTAPEPWSSGALLVYEDPASDAGSVYIILILL